MTPAEAAVAIEVAVNNKVTDVRNQVDARLTRGANELRNQALNVLANPSPSAPGSPPGVRSGDLRRNWSMGTASAAGAGGSFWITSGMGYAGYLEHGTSKMAARPFVEKIKEASMPKIHEIFSEIK